ncbi:LacI family DNA-binding transcriptional regulator [Grimontia marina]|uniref:Autoinducer 2-binding periplasmic protein LuxP n=1 Tax=Grimontia marina TaxID=646534 RepID=A0A128FIH9_9GAMM|nr:LacI family DNA-binding transcriptional regulator [Grimontia marina]CZF86076.1 HTH-type transcriptional repressor PurR [Grimontia marina]
MAKRVTIKQIAEYAKVSVATVDRVINQRARVKSATANRIIAAAKELGWRPPAAFVEAQSASPTPSIHCGILLQSNISHLLREAFEAQSAKLENTNSKLTIETFDSLEPEKIAARMLKLGKKVDVLAITSIDHPFVAEAIDKLAEKNVPVVAILSDLSANNLAGFVGTNNRTRGRTAAWAMDRFCRDRGTVGVIIGSHRYLSQQDREISFRSYFREKAPAFRILESVVSSDDDSQAYEAAKKLVCETPDLVGIFSAGGGASGIRRAIIEYGGDRRPFFVSTELTAQAKTELLQGGVDMVLSADFDQVAEKAVEMFASLKQQETQQKKMTVLPFFIYTSENT